MRAWLTGVGAMTLANAVVFSLAFELWSDGILQFRGVRPEFEIVGLPAYAFGAAVAVGTGGWRGLIALVVLASLWMVDVPFIPGADRDFFLRQLWAYAGIVLGVLIAAVRPLRLSSTAFIGAGVYGIAIVPSVLLATVILQQPLCQSDGAARCITAVDAFSVLSSLVGGVAAGLVVGRKLSFGGMTLLALTLALPSAVVVAHQGWMWQYDGLLLLAVMARSIAGGLALVLAAVLARWTRDRGGVAGPMLRPHARTPA
ncbi:MAG: hypothetical protein E6I28_13120 [Chloroflexi bacterium]|nr:MAG: hypothetical protein E6I28_13120 [Chloroflexota bacterium]